MELHGLLRPELHRRVLQQRFDVDGGDGDHAHPERGCGRTSMPPWHPAPRSPATSPTARRRRTTSQNICVSVNPAFPGPNNGSRDQRQRRRPMPTAITRSTASPRAATRSSFSPCGGPGGGGNFVSEYYNGAADVNTATTVTLAAAESRNDINASMEAGATISGKVTDSAGTPNNLQGICVGVGLTSGGGFDSRIPTQTATTRSAGCARAITRCNSPRAAAGTT